MGMDLPREVVIGRVAGLGDVVLATEAKLEDDGPYQTPAVVRHDLGIR
jgi:hypothetical protein